MAKRLEGSEFVNPKFFDDFKKGAKESLNLINEIKTQLKNDIAANSKQLNLISPDSVKSIQEFNKQVEVSKAKIQELQVVQAKEIQLQKDVESASKKATAQRQKEQKQYESNRIAEDRLNKSRERAFDRYERQLRKEQRALERTSGLYNKIQRGVTSVTKTYNDLAAKKALNGKLNAKEEIQLVRLSAKLNKYQGVLKSVDANIGKHNRNVGNYASGFNGMQNSINQLTREMPAFANSVQTGFMAISNNLPIFFDEISRAKKEIAGLRAEGKKTNGLLSRLGKSLFSMGTLLSVGVTLLTLYGKELVEWISDLIESTKAVDSLKLANEQLQKVEQEGIENAQKQITKLKLLNIAVQDTSKSEEERNNILNDLRKDYGKDIDHLTDREILTNGIGDAEKKLAENILIRARADAAASIISENEVKRLKLEQEYNEITKDKATLQEEVNSELSKGVQVYSKYGDNIDRAMKAQSKINSIDTKANKNLKEQNALIEANKKLSIEAIKGIGDGSSSSSSRTSGGSGSGSSSGFELLDNSDKEKKAIAESFKRRFTIPREKRKKFNEKLQKDTDKFVSESLKAIKANLDKENELEEERIADEKTNSDKLIASAKERARTLQNLSQSTTKRIQEESAKRIRAIDREVEASKNRADTLKAIAAQGNIDAKESIALEEKRQAKATLQKEKEIRKQKQIEASLAMLKTYTSELEKTGDSKKAIGAVLKNGVLLSGLINALPSFYDGTEDTGKGGGIDGKGGFLSVLHPNERVVNAENNKHLKGITNTELPMAAAIYRQVKNSDTSVSKDNTLIKEVKELNKSINSIDIPNYATQLDDTTGTLLGIMKYKNRTEKVSKRVGIW